jgi:hypothetical protein
MTAVAALLEPACAGHPAELSAPHDGAACGAAGPGARPGGHAGRGQTLDEALRALARGEADACLVCGAALPSPGDADVCCDTCGSTLSRAAPRRAGQLALL